MMSLVDDEPLVRGKHRRIRPVLLRAPHREIAEQQVMVDDDHIRLRGDAASGEEKALVEERALETQTQIGLRRDLVPQLRLRRRRKIRERAVLRALGPRANLLQSVRRTVRKESGRRAGCLLESIEAEIIAPTLQQGKTHRLVRERVTEKGEILADELLLQIDRVRRHDRALSVRGSPPQRGQEVAERLSYTGAGLEQRDTAFVVQRRDRARHLPLRGTILVAREPRGDGPAGPERIGDGARDDRHGDARLRHLDHDVELRRVVVDDPESDAAVVQPRGDGEIRVGRLE